MPMYEILLARHFAVRIVIEADSKEAAHALADAGDWEDSDITDSRCVDTTVVDVELAYD
jgi:uncharacterized protein YciI